MQAATQQEPRLLRKSLWPAWQGNEERPREGSEQKINPSYFLTPPRHVHWPNPTGSPKEKRIKEMQTTVSSPLSGHRTEQVWVPALHRRKDTQDGWSLRSRRAHSAHRRGSVALKCPSSEGRPPGSSSRLWHLTVVIAR